MEVQLVEKIRLGRTNLEVTRSGFGALPIQRVSFDEGKKILRKAYEAGINFYDTARGYSDSEEKIGKALSDVREDIIIATKSMTDNGKDLLRDLETSLRKLNTDYIDIYQIHNPSFFPTPGDESGIYDALVYAKEKGLVRHIGITNHRLEIAKQAIESSLYDTLQFPLSSLSSDEDLKLISGCKEKDIGLIAMKALSGGLITNVASTFAFLRQYNNVVPIWGIQREWELDEFVSLESNPPKLDEAMWEVIKKDRKELAISFCRGCGYCLPCPVDIPINNVARMPQLLTRSPYERFMAKDWRENMDKVNDCIECGQCKSRCPYGLDIPNLIRENLKIYDDFYYKYKEEKVDAL